MKNKKQSLFPSLKILILTIIAVVGIITTLKTIAKYIQYPSFPEVLTVKYIESLDMVKCDHPYILENFLERLNIKTLNSNSRIVKRNGRCGIVNLETMEWLGYELYAGYISWKGKYGFESGYSSKMYRVKGGAE